MTLEVRNDFPAPTEGKKSEKGKFVALNLYRPQIKVNGVELHTVSLKP